MVLVMAAVAAAETVLAVTLLRVAAAVLGLVGMLRLAAPTDRMLLEEQVVAAAAVAVPTLPVSLVGMEAPVPFWFGTLLLTRMPTQLRVHRHIPTPEDTSITCGLLPDK
jgi:hypothetical protein